MICPHTPRYTKDGQDREACKFVKKSITRVTCLQELEIFCKQRTQQLTVSGTKPAPFPLEHLIMWFFTACIVFLINVLRV